MAGATSKNRKGIKKAQAEELWAKSAGRCNICNTSLLRDATTGVEAKTGQKAHIVGVGDGPRSPRGNHPLPRRERDLATNLILLCEKHHTEVDARPQLYSVDYLRKLKRDFEERIFFLTGLGEERKTLVYRVLGAIHGHKEPDLDREEVRSLILREEGRYPRSDLAAAEYGVLLDLRDLTNEGSPEYWAEVERQLERHAEQVRALSGDGLAGHVSVLGLARIPALVMLGDSLGDASNLSIYHRRNQKGWGWDRDAGLPSFELVKRRQGESDDIALMVSLTAFVKDETDSDDVVDRSTLYELRPLNATPGSQLLDHPEARHAFGQAYRDFLSLVEKDHPDCRTIHLIPAIPADAAITLGQIRTPAVTPALRVYDFNKDTGIYEFACEVGR